MKKVFCAENTIEVGLINGILEANGINCLIKNQNLGGALGEIPPFECWPEIWVTNDADYPRAVELVKETSPENGSSREDWLCLCGEQIESQFSACWQCGAERPME